MASIQESGRATLRALLYGVGVAGRRIAQGLHERGIAIVGAVDTDPRKVGSDLGALAGLPVAGIEIRDDVRALVDAVGADVVLHATRYDPVAIVRELTPALQAGIDVVSVSGISDLAGTDERLAATLDAEARKGGATVLGTGLNPGFLQDLLPIVLTGACDDVHRVAATRITDFAPWGPEVMAHYGIGLSEAAFRSGVESGRIGLHAEIRQSLAMIARALAWRIVEAVGEREPLLTESARSAEHVRIGAGTVCGFRHRAVAACGTGRSIALELVGIVHPDRDADGVEPGTEITIDGTPAIRCRIDGELNRADGVYAATAARALNAIPHVLAAPPGLLSVADLPVVACWRGPAPAPGARRTS